MLHPHELEEIEFRNGPVLWDADPTVCCAAYQLGACSHTEVYYEDEDPEQDMTRDELVDLYGAEAVAQSERILAQDAAREARRADHTEEPF